MNFEELYEKYQNKTATEEEIAYVEGEIAKARRLSAILDEQDQRRAIKPADEETTERSVRRFLKKTRIRIALTAALALVLLAALLFGGVYTYALIGATNRSRLSRDEAAALCCELLVEKGYADSTDGMRVEIERDLALHHGLSRAYFEYDVEISYEGREYEFYVDATGSEARLVEID